MTDQVADTALLMKMIDSLAEELRRQGVVDALADGGLDLTALARAAIRASSNDNVIPLRQRDT